MRSIEDIWQDVDDWAEGESESLSQAEWDSAGKRLQDDVPELLYYIERLQDECYQLESLDFWVIDGI